MSFAGAAYAIFRPEAYALDLLPPNLERFTQIIGNTMRGRMAISQLGSCTSAEKIGGREKSR